MREIKFRGKSPNGNGEWVYGFYTQGCFYNPNTGESIVRHIINSDMLYDIDPDTLGQYIGLHDKNGKEIYEGDIVDVVSLDTSTFGEKKRAVIVYDEEMCCFDFKGADRQRCMCVSIPDVEIMIIGNIWDNHELIPYKDKQQ